MFDHISVGEVKDLGGVKFSVRLTVEAPEGALSRTETVAAEGHDAGVQIAKESFAPWLKKLTEYAIKNMPTIMQNQNTLSVLHPAGESIDTSTATCRCGLLRAIARASRFECQFATA
jgi:hypothetical protein